jgi:hypothetical protein
MWIRFGCTWQKAQINKSLFNKVYSFYIKVQCYTVKCKGPSTHLHYWSIFCGLHRFKNYITIEDVVSIKLSSYELSHSRYPERRFEKYDTHCPLNTPSEGSPVCDSWVPTCLVEICKNQKVTLILLIRTPSQNYFCNWKFWSYCPLMWLVSLWAGKACFLLPMKVVDSLHSACSPMSHLCVCAPGIRRLYLFIYLFIWGLENWYHHAETPGIFTMNDKVSDL